MASLILPLGMLAIVSGGTDFGVRAAPGVALPREQRVVAASAPTPVTGSRTLAAAASLAVHWGRVTSTVRTPTHNKAVGGVANSYHLRGRAIDIARRPGVTHASIAAAFRLAGYQLVESLDEGDHSHFAFAWGSRMPSFAAAAEGTREVTNWGMVTVGRSGR